MIKKICKACIYRMINIKLFDDLMIRLNDLHNDILKKRLLQSMKRRIVWYGEGEIRLSNDPDIHLYYRWPTFGSMIWTEVPCFNIQAMKLFEKPFVLELGCANGWYYREFYSGNSNCRYVGCDINEDTIKEAQIKLRKKEKMLNKLFDAKFLVADMLEKIPLEGENLTNVFWFASMCMFTKEQRKDIFIQIVARLKKNNGILSGRGVLVDKKQVQWTYYIGLFDSIEQLREELEEYFKNVFIMKSTAKNLIFYMASDGILPFYEK